MLSKSCVWRPIGYTSFYGPKCRRSVTAKHPTSFNNIPPPRRPSFPTIVLLSPLRGDNCATKTHLHATQITTFSPCILTVRVHYGIENLLESKCSKSTRIGFLKKSTRIGCIWDISCKFRDTPPLFTSLIPCKA